jgi:SAM-dependent methyltransferase
MYLRRWDAPDEYRTFQMPDNARLAEKLLPKLAQSPPLTAVDAILHSLRGFRRIRLSLPSSNALDAIRIFNAFLLGVEAVRTEQLDERGWAACKRIGEAIRMLCTSQVETEEALGITELRKDSLGADIGDLLDWFLRPEPMTGFSLEPSLLLRHAAGQLYQEAHIVIERDQLHLPGLAGDTKPRGRARSDVHFTPVPLARFLVEEALAERAELTSGLTVLDPACGSGVFLLEALRELQSRGVKGKVRLQGFDISEVSCAMARFCLARAKREATESGIDADVSIEQADALTVEWGQPDVVLMNPPFVSWEGMDKHDRDTAVQVLGAVGKKRVDKAMAFIWKAARCLAPGGVLASLLPAPLFETQAGVDWREGIASEGELRFIGRLRGYGYFQDAAVEPGMLVLTRPEQAQVRRHSPIRLLLAEEGREDEAIRGMRRYREAGGPSRGDGWEVAEAPDTMVAESWMPRSGEQIRWIETLSHAGIPKVGELFVVHQGIRTGWNRAFVLAEDKFRGLPKREQRFFRPVASSSTIERGVIHRAEFVFYPYDLRGLTLATEDQLKSALPNYYANWLKPQRAKLVSRSRARASKWWVLTHERKWQREKQPKLVSKSFGEMGSFGYDQTGELVVLQGYGWLWREDADMLSRAEFFQSRLPFSYLAILNSPIFEALLDFFCLRVQGGQYDLAPRFIDRVFLPNLADATRIPGDMISHLAGLGRQIHEGKMPDSSILADAAGRAYGIPNAEIEDLLTSGVR